MKPVHHHFWMLFSLVDGQARIEAEGYIQINTPFAVHYEKIRIHLREKATNSAKIHLLARKSEPLRINQIQ